MAYEILPRLQKKLKEVKIDALMVVKPESFYYVTGFQNHTGGMDSNPGSGRQLVAIAVVPADEGLEPAMIVSSWEQHSARASWIKDIHVFPAWMEIFDLNDLVSGNLKRVAKPTQYSMEQNVATAARIIRERGLDKGTIGIELDFICDRAISYVRRELPDAKIVDSSRLLWDIQAVKTPREIELLKAATQMTKEAATATMSEDLLGLTVGEVRTKYQMHCLRLAAANPALGYQNNKCTMSIGGDFAPKPGSPPYHAAKGDVVFFDPGVNLRGYFSDIGRSFVIDQEPTELQRRIYFALRLGIETIMDAVKPGMKCSELFQLGQEAVRNAGTDLSAYTRGHMGHAIGIHKGERPPFIAPTDHTILEPNMVFSIEAPLYVQGLGGFNIEDSIVVTETGCELFTEWSREIHQVGKL
jgi:Xaa-Pro dipeptidase